MSEFIFVRHENTHVLERRLLELLKVKQVRHLGLISILLTWLVGVVMYVLWYQPDIRALSYLGVSNLASYIMFALTLTSAGMIFLVFMQRWFIPSFGLNIVFLYSLMAAVGSQLVLAWIPAIGGLPLVLHRVSAYALAYAVLVMAVIITLNQRVSSTAKTLNWLFLLAMVTIVILSFMPRYVAGHRVIIYYQIYYILAFHFIILATTYLGRPQYHKENQ